MIAELFAVVAPVYLCIAIGFAWKLLGRRVDTDLMADLCMNVGAPCLIFASLVGLEVDLGEVVGLVGIIVLAHLLFAVSGYVVLRVTGLSTKTFLAPMVFANTGNMGLPVAYFAFGDAGLVVGVTYFAVSAILHFTVGQWAWSGAMSLRQLVRTPLVYAVVLAMLVLAMEWQVPVWLLRTSENVGAFTIPVMQFTLGVSLAQLKVARLSRSIGLSLVRIGMGVSVGVLLAYAFGLEGATRGVLILDCAMPVAVVNYLFASVNKRSPEEVASVVVISSAIAFLTIPLILVFVL